MLDFVWVYAVFLLTSLLGGIAFGLFFVGVDALFLSAMVASLAGGIAAVLLWYYRQEELKSLLPKSLKDTGKAFGHALVAMIIAIPLIIGAYYLTQWIISGAEPPVNPLVEWARESADKRIAFYFLVVIIAPISEELQYRLILYEALRKNIVDEGENGNSLLRRHMPIIVSAMIFALLHFQPFHVLQLFVIGYVLGMLRERSRTSGEGLAPPIFMHMLNNALFAIVML